jgi:hypothetical protein
MQRRTITHSVLSGMSCALILVGCARPSASAWQAADVSQLERDHAACYAESQMIQPSAGGLGGIAGAAMLLSGVAAQRKYYENCMTARGYTRAK